MNLKIFFSLALVFIFFINCNNQSDKTLNNEQKQNKVEYLQDDFKNFENKVIYNLDIDIQEQLNKASTEEDVIEISTNYLNVFNTNYDKALLVFQIGLSKIPKKNIEWKLYEKIAEIYMQKQKYHNAMDNLNKAISNGGDKITSVVSKLAFCYMSTDNFIDAEKYYKKSLELDKNAVTLGNLANLYYNENKLDLALEYFLKAYKLDNSVYEASYAIGDIYFRQEKYSKAIEYYLNCIEITPKKTASYNALSQCYNKLGETQKAWKYFIKMLYLSGKYDTIAKTFNQKDENNILNDVDLLYIYITSFIKVQDYQFALKLISKGEKLYPENPEFIIAKTEIDFLNGNYQKVIDTSKEYLKKYPKNPRLNIQIAKSYQKLGDKFKMLIFYENTLKLNENDVNTREVVASIYRKDEDLLNYFDIETIRAMEYYHQGIAFYYKKQNMESVETLSKVNIAKIKDYSYLYYYYLAMNYIDLEQIDKAGNYLKKSYSLKKKYYKTNIGIAEFLVKKGEPKEAINHLLAYKKSFGNDENISKINEKIKYLKDKYKNLTKN